MKKTLDIESLLRWAWRDELLKTQAAVNRLAAIGFNGGWDGISKYGMLLASVDECRNQWGLAPDYMATNDPHPDAVLVAQAVARLEGMDIHLPESWNPLADMGDLGALGTACIMAGVAKVAVCGADGIWRMKAKLRSLICKHAILGGAPDWIGETPTLRTYRHVNGKTKWFARQIVATPTFAGGEVLENIEVNGWPEGRRKALPGAYIKHYLDPDPLPVVVERAEYQAWHHALEMLAADLEGTMACHEVSGPARAAVPWQDGEAAAGRVWPAQAPAAPAATETIKRRKAWAA